MKSIFTIILLALLAGGIYYGVTYKKSPEVTNNPPTQTENRSAALQKITFAYPEGYVLLEQNMTGLPNLNKTLVVMQEEDYASIQRGEREGGEGPATITLQEYKNPEKLTARAWAEKYVHLSNLVTMGGVVTESEIEGLPAIRYNSDGLYADRNVIFVKDEFLYFLSGAYLDQDSDLYRDFDKILESIKIK